MVKSYKEIVSLIGDELENLNNSVLEDIQYPTVDLKEFLSSTGKKIRPVLAFLFLKMFNCKITTEQFDLAASVELAHNASLIHDDIIDMSTIRRARETFEVKFDTKTAVMTGDYLLSLAFKKLLKIGNNDIIKGFTETFSQMSTGEIDEFFDKFKIPTLETYIEKTINKTARLFEIALKSSAILANGDEKLWGDFGLNFGIAFQIKNDLDNFYGDNSDIKNGIYTAPVIFSGSKEVTTEGIQKTKLLINNYIEKASAFLKNCPQNEYRKALESILELYVNE